MMIRPQIAQRLVRGALVYRKSEYSFAYLPADPEILSAQTAEGSTTSLVIGTLQIEVDIATGLLLYIWGYHPFTAWATGTVPQPVAGVTALQLLSDEPLVRGTSTRLGSSPDWTTIYDPRSNWVQVRKEGSQSDAYFEFATDTVAGLTREERLVELLLKPAFVD